MNQNDFYFNLVGARSDRDLWLDINDYDEEGLIIFYRDWFLKSF